MGRRQNRPPWTPELQFLPEGGAGASLSHLTRDAFARGVRGLYAIYASQHGHAIYRGLEFRLLRSLAAVK